MNSDESIECHLENLGHCPRCAEPLGTCPCTIEDYEALGHHLFALAQDLREARADERF